MELSPDYEDLFKILNAFKIKYLVVGAYAVMYYTEPRYTKDIDIWIIPNINDANKVFKALAAYGAPLKSLSPEDFKDKKMILQIGVAPVRVDIMVNVPGISFKEAWKNRKKIRYGKTPINILSASDLIKSKKEAGRAQDKIDLQRLLEKFKK